MLVLWLQDFLKRSFEIYSSCKGKILTLCVCVYGCNSLVSPRESWKSINGSPPSVSVCVDCAVESFCSSLRLFILLLTLGEKAKVNSGTGYLCGSIVGKAKGLKSRKWKGGWREGAFLTGLVLSLRFVFTLKIQHGIGMAGHDMILTLHSQGKSEGMCPFFIIYFCSLSLSLMLRHVYVFFLW